MRTPAIVCWTFHRRHRHLRGSSTYYPHQHCNKCCAMRDFWKSIRVSWRNKIWVDWLGYRYRPDGVRLYHPKKERSST